MLKTLWNGRSGLYSTQNRLDVISNNMANTETNGYKRMDLSFQDIYNENLNRLGLPVTAEDKSALTAGSGVRAEAAVRNFSQGMLVETGNETDIAIDGAGYFKLVDGEGQEFYTRDGSFKIENYLNTDNGEKSIRLVHSSGLVLGDDIKFSSKLEGPLTINPSGEVYSGKNKIGKIGLYDFKDRDSMISAGNSLFKGQSQPYKVEDSRFSLKQGYVERSNVDLAKELTDMMITQRAYTLNSKSIKAADEMWQIANNLRGR